MSTEYMIVVEWEWNEIVARNNFARAVNQHLSAGWQLQGGVSVAGVTATDGRGMSKFVYAQAMTREQKVEP